MAVVSNSCLEDDLIERRKGKTNFKISATTKFSGVASRATLDNEVDITNYCFLLFDNNTDSGVLTTAIDIADLKTSPYYLEIPIAETGKTYCAILLGNVTVDILKGQGLEIGTTTLADMVQFSVEVKATDNAPQDAKSFTWSAYLDVDPQDPNLAFFLNPNVAKITVNITNNSTKSDIVNVQLKNVPNKIRYAQNALSKSGKFDSDMNKYLDKEKSEEMGFITYNIEGLELANGKSETVSWYIPHNECGTGSRPKDGAAGELPANQNPTYIEIDSKRVSDFMDVAYKIYPGTGAKVTYDELDNYNIIADNQYEMNISITNEGVTYTANKNVGNNSDVRVEKVVLPPHNNCYMIHPKYSDSVNPAAVGTDNNTTVYELPIYERINEFWGNTSGGSGNVIDDNYPWVMEVIWQDINARAIWFTDETGSKDLDKFNCIGKKPVYFKLDRTTLDASTPGYDSKKDIYGNILVGVKKADSNGNPTGDYLWSWHLWLTDYNPDVAVNSAYTNKTSNTLYIMNSSNTSPGDIDMQGMYYNEDDNSPSSYESYLYKGMVQHYKSTMAVWTSKTPSTSDVPSYNSSSSVWDNGGIYANKWIMDRNLGAQSPNNADIANPMEAFGLYYQFGRKDPFSYNDIYDIYGNVKSSKWTIADYDTGTIEKGVKNPNIFYKVSSTAKWASNASSNAWFNPDWNNSGYIRGQKTLFDPCPPGWCVPVHEIYSYTVSSTSGDRVEKGKSPHAVLEVHVNTTSTSNHTIVDPYRGFCDIVSNTSSTDYIKAIYPLAGYIYGEGSTAGTIIGFTTSGRAYKYAVDEIRGCVWTLDYNNDGNGRLLQIQPTSLPLVGSDIGIESYNIKGRCYRTHYARVSIRNWVTARGQNVRCIQIPD